MDLAAFINEAGIKPDKTKDQFFLIDSKILDEEAALLQLKEKRSTLNLWHLEVP